MYFSCATWHEVCTGSEKQRRTARDEVQAWAARAHCAASAPGYVNAAAKLVMHPDPSTVRQLSCAPSLRRARAIGPPLPSARADGSTQSARLHAVRQQLTCALSSCSCDVRGVPAHAAKTCRCGRLLVPCVAAWLCSVRTLPGARRLWGEGGHLVRLHAVNTHSARAVSNHVGQGKGAGAGCLSSSLGVCHPWHAPDCKAFDELAWHKLFVTRLSCICEAQAVGNGVGSTCCCCEAPAKCHVCVKMRVCGSYVLPALPNGSGAARSTTVHCMARTRPRFVAKLSARPAYMRPDFLLRRESRCGGGPHRWVRDVGLLASTACPCF